MPRPTAIFPATLASILTTERRLASGWTAAKRLPCFRDGAGARREKIENFFDYGWPLIQTLMRSQYNRHLESGDWHLTVFIETLGVGITEFDLKDETKRDLKASGRAGTEQYFECYDANAPENRPLNRPLD